MSVTWTEEDLINFSKRRKQIVSRLKCKQCGIEFFAPESENRKFCSLKCAYDNPERIAINPKDRGNTNCENCKKEFKINTTSGKARFCSRKCSNYFIGKITLPINRAKRISTKTDTRKCIFCGGEFRCWSGNKKKYCSIKCASMGMDRKLNVSAYLKTMRENPQNTYSRCKRGWRRIGDKRIYFRSRMEANYARYLEFSGVKWEYESKTFWFSGIKRGVVSYTPDFFIPDKNIFIETKGWMDDKSRTKIKRMAKYHPDVKLIIVDYKTYKSIERQVGQIVPGWEK